MGERPEAGAPATPGHDEALRVVLSDLTGGQRRAQLHLLTCDACRQKAAAALRQAPGAGSGPAVEARAMLARLQMCSDFSEVLKAAAEGAQTGESLLSELLAVAEEDRMAALREQRFRSPYLLEMLLQRARAAQPEDPEESCALAVLATQLALRLKERSTGDAEMWNPEINRAVNLTGNARRLLGAWRLAEETLTFTVNDRGCEGFDWENVCGCRYLGLVRWEQGRVTEAEALLRQALRGFEELESPPEEATTRALLGLLAAESGQPERGVLLLQAARATLPFGRPWLSAQVGLGFALALAEAGQPGRARQALAETWPLYPTGEQDLLRLHWLEGRVHDRLGDRQNAEPLYRAIRAELADRGRLAEAAVCTHELLVLLRATRRGAEVSVLSRETERLCAQDLKLREAWGMVQRSSPADPRRRVSHREAAEALRLVRHLFRERGCRVEALPFV